MAHEQCIEELCYITCLFCGDGFGLWPFREMICYHHDKLYLLPDGVSGMGQQDQCLFAAILPASQEQVEERVQVCQTCALHVGIHHMIESVDEP